LVRILPGLVAWALVLAIGCNWRGDGETAGGKSALKDGSPVEGAAGEKKEAAQKAALSPQEVAFAEERDRMVEQLSSSASDAPITDARVLDVMRRVPRHEFVPAEYREHSYQNTPLPIAENQTISQPYIVALMTQLLDLKGTEKVLEIGTGSGYQAAILGELAGEVYTVEIRPQLLDTAKKKLEELKAKGVLQWKKLVAVVGDGSKGYQEAAPYDAIIVTAAPRKVPVDLLNQLKPGGRLVIPVGDLYQVLQLIRKKEDGTYSEEAVVPVRFVPLVHGRDQK